MEGSEWNVWCSTSLTYFVSTSYWCLLRQIENCVSSLICFHMPKRGPDQPRWLSGCSLPSSTPMCSLQDLFLTGKLVHSEKSVMFIALHVGCKTFIEVSCSQYADNPCVFSLSEIRPIGFSLLYSNLMYDRGAVFGNSFAYLLPSLSVTVVAIPVLFISFQLSVCAKPWTCLLPFLNCMYVQVC